MRENYRSRDEQLNSELHRIAERERILEPGLRAYRDMSTDYHYRAKSVYKNNGNRESRKLKNIELCITHYCPRSQLKKPPPVCGSSSAWKICMEPLVVSTDM